MKSLKYQPLLAILFISLSSFTINDEVLISFSQYSEYVGDTFYVDVQLPKEYHANPEKNYPTVLLLDGNFYFPMMSSIVHQYEVTGLLPPIILVSIGYSSFQAMDSLRVRDYMFPKALPSDEMNAVGGGKRFKDYLIKELIPKIDNEFRTEEKSRTLLGHSFGGYFVLYSLLDQLKSKTNDFNYFISASPTLWYNDFYLKQLPNELASNNENLNLFMSVGSLEDSTWSIQPVIDLSDQIEKTHIGGLNFKSRVYNHLNHMDVGILTFTKGLQELMMINE